MLDVAALGLAPGDVRRVDVPIEMDPLRFGGETYDVDVPGAGRVELQATSGGLYLKLRFAATVTGPCYRCLEDAHARVTVDASEYQEHGADPENEDLSTEYLADDELDVDRCGARLEPGVGHDCAPPETDPRWESLRQLLE
jgi:DUF177 domain-containing protein